MIEAGCEGLIDYSTANLLDPKWWQKLWLVLTHLKRKQRIQLNEYQMQFNLAALDYGSNQQTFDLHWQQALLARNGLINDILVSGKKLAQNTSQVIDQLRDQWVEKWGDPSSPETSANIQGLRDHWAKIRQRRRPANGGI